MEEKSELTAAIPLVFCQLRKPHSPPSPTDTAKAEWSVPLPRRQRATARGAGVTPSRPRVEVMPESCRLGIVLLFVSLPYSPAPPSQVAAQVPSRVLTPTNAVQGLSKYSGRAQRSGRLNVIGGNGKPSGAARAAEGSRLKRALAWRQLPKGYSCLPASPYRHLRHQRSPRRRDRGRRCHPVAPPFLRWRLRHVACLPR